MEVNSKYRPIREIVSAKYRARSQVWLVGMFVLLRLADLVDWTYFTSGPARQLLLVGYSHQGVIGWLVSNALLTTAMLVGLWFRQRWVRGVLKVLLGMELVVSCIAMASAASMSSAFPAALLVSTGLRLVVLLVLSYARDIRLFLSVAYFDTYA